MLHESEKSKLDDAARAGWLYFIAGHTQDEIAKMFQISRASAQRLISHCLAERLITFHLEHPIAACMELASKLKKLFGLIYCEVVPSDPVAPTSVTGIAERGAHLLETMLRGDQPAIIALGTGRAVRAAVERVSSIERPMHHIVSLVGTVSADGSASFFDTVGRLADRTHARYYPMPLPFLMSSKAECDQMLAIDSVAQVHAIAARSDLRLMGVGQMDDQAQIHIDGFVSKEELKSLQELGAVGELIGWPFDKSGRLIPLPRKRLTSVSLSSPPQKLSVGMAIGAAKVTAIKAALKGRLLNGLITDESTANAIISEDFKEP